MECFTGGHAALAVFAILVLGLCAVLIVVVVVITMEKVKVCYCMYVASCTLYTYYSTAPCSTYSIANCILVNKNLEMVLEGSISATESRETKDNINDQAIQRLITIFGKH